MIENYSPITVILASGRVLRVDMLLFEARVLPLEAAAYSAADLPMLAKRPWLVWAESVWYKPDPIHFKIENRDVESAECDDLMLVTALLYSNPVSSEGGFSELLVVTYLHWNTRGGFQSALQEALIDLDWETLAVDRPLHSELHSP